MLMPHQLQSAYWECHLAQPGRLNVIPWPCLLAGISQVHLPRASIS